MTTDGPICWHGWDVRRLPVLPAYGAAAVIDVVLAAAGQQGARRFTKPLLMPLLAAHFAGSDDRDGCKPLIFAGLGLSGLGDIALLSEGEGPFGLGLASFLAAHCCYLAAFAKRRRGGVRQARWVAGVYGLAWGGLNVVLFPHTGRLRFPVLAYGTALTGMAIAALNTGVPTVAAGGAAFLVSDSILALDTFGAARLPAAQGLVMLTYTAAQALIAVGMASTETTAERVASARR